jgi:hypothetical protein
MSVKNFIPKVWSASLETNFRAQALATGLTNTQYTGTLAAGNTVQVTTAVDVAIKDYKAAGRTTTPDDVAATDNSLVIDQEKNFDFKIDDIDRAQVAGNLDAYTQSASLGLALDADQHILATLVAQSDNTGAPAGAVFDSEDTKAAYNVIKGLMSTLNKRNVPKQSRWLIANSDFMAPFFSYDSKFTKAQESELSNQAVRDATIGHLLTFNILVTDNLPGSTAGVAQASAVYTPALHYVSQIQKTEAMRAENSFADRLRGLHVYGAKLLRPQAAATFTATTV